MNHPPIYRPLYACRDNATFSLLFVNRPRCDRFCRRCAPLRAGMCCLHNRDQVARLQHALRIDPLPGTLCTTCHRPNPDREYLTCPACRAKSLDRIRRLRS